MLLAFTISIKFGAAHHGMVVELHLDLMLKIGPRLDTTLDDAVSSSELQTCINTCEKPLHRFFEQFHNEHCSL